MSMSEGDLDNLDTDVQEALDNIEANDRADPTPIRVDPSTLPGGMTAEETVDAWARTGNIIIDTSGTTTSGAVYIPNDGAAYVTGTDPIIPQQQEVEPPQPRAIPETETPEQVQESVEEQQEKLAQKKKENDELIEQDRRITAKATARRKKRLAKSFRNYEMDHTEIVIVEDGGVQLIKIDIQRKGKIENLNNHRLANKRRGGLTRPLNHTIIYDKNMNPLIMNYSDYEKVVLYKGFSRVAREVVRQENINIPSSIVDRYIVIDKESFMKSKGRDFKIKHRVNYSVYEALVIKRKMIEKIDSAERFITHMKGLIGNVYDEENFEILYNMSFNATSSPRFNLFFQFPNLTLTNSIELTHLIENIVIRMQGTHFAFRGNNSMMIQPSIEGQRTKFSPVDAFYGFNHSHLPSYPSGLDGFCMGESHFMSGMNSTATTDIEVEMLLYGLMDHIAWESLEGGPYTSMESVGTITGTTPNEHRGHILRAYSGSAARSILRYMTELDLSPLQDAFTLTIQRNKEVTYTFDRHMFIMKFLNIIDADMVQDISEDYDVLAYSYYVADQKFKSNTTDYQVAGNWHTFKKGGLQRVHALDVMYINGKYIRPQITQFNKTVKPTKESMISFHPDILMHIARVIHYHLLNELKNV